MPDFIPTYLATIAIHPTLDYELQTAKCEVQ